jgi:hypothetical protein
MTVIPNEYRFTPAAQRAFLEVLAETGSVQQAADAIGKSRGAAYALKHRGEGELFRLGWDGALLVARDTLADTMLDRAINGQTDVMDRDPDTGRRVRSRIDNRLAMSMLTRLDNILQASPHVGTIHSAAWRISQRWSTWLDLVAAGAGADAMIAFLRKGPGSEIYDDFEDMFDDEDFADAFDDDSGDCPEKGTVPFSDDSNAARLAPLPATPLTPAAGTIPSACNDTNEQCQLGQDGIATDTAEAPPHSQWQNHVGAWRTDRQPPHGFDGDEVGTFGEACYSRSMTADEIADIAANDSAQNSTNEQCQLGEDAADDPAETKTLDPTQFTSCGTRIYKPGSTTLYTEEYQRLSGFKQIICNPPPFSFFDGRCTRIN